MSDMKCPFCQQELRSVIQQEGENTHTTWHCPKCELGKYKWACGNKTLWQALIDTKKKLDIAVGVLEDIAESNGDFITGSSTTLDVHEYAEMMLKEIKRQMKIKTALEQKDK